MVFKTSSPLPELSFQGFPSDGLPVIDTNALLEAALYASWQRDQRVGRRRLAVRWVLWWLWKYGIYVLAVLAMLVLAFFLLYPEAYSSPTAPANLSVGRNTSASNAVVPVQSNAASNVQLRIDSQLLEQRARAEPSGSTPEDTPLPYPLKLETQLKIKESTP
jgi:hypothetical protein